MANERAWSHASKDNDETFNGHHATREEAIAAGTEEYEGEIFWICEFRKMGPTECVPSASEILEIMTDRAVEAVGDAAEDFPDVADEAIDELDALLDAWAEKHVECDLWTHVGKPEKVDPAAASAT